MSDEQSVEDLAEMIMGIADRVGFGTNPVNAKREILELLQSRQSISVTEEWIEEKALELNNEILLESHGHDYYKVAKNFILSLVEVMPAKTAGVDKDWLPTPENINALPEPVRKYIYDIRTNCDPAGMVRENVLIKDTCKMLVLKLEEKKEEMIKSEEWLSDFLRRMPIYDAQPRKDYTEKRLKEIGVEIVKK